MRHPAAFVAAIALGLMLGGCSSFDPMEWFSTKKPLPGERKEVFPAGVPGVPHGVPPELVEGYQPPAEPPPEVAETPPEPPKKKPKPKPRPRTAAAPAAAPARPATAVTIQPANRGGGSFPPPQQPTPQQPAEAPSPWPAPQQSASGPTQSRWPDPPPAR